MVGLRCACPTLRSTFRNSYQTSSQHHRRNREVVKTIANLKIMAACACLVTCGLCARADAVQLGNMQANSILFLGNSITFCPQTTPPTQGNWWGLSATAPANDYAHLL